MSKLFVELNKSNLPVTGKLVVKLEESHLGHIQEHDEFANRLYSESSKSIQRERIQVSHRSHKIPLWLVFTGLSQIPYGIFQLGPGFVPMSPQRRRRIKSNLCLRSRIATRLEATDDKKASAPVK